MSDWKPRRFWQSATVSEAEGGFTVTLDGRPVRTPAKSLLVVPSRALAQAIAAEWDAQEKVVDPDSMPITRSANSAIDKVGVQFNDVATMLAAYGDSDLLCYRAASPVELVDRQGEHWDPLLDWAAESFGARLQPRIGVIHVSQDQAALKRLSEVVFALSPFELTAFHDLVALSGSLVIGLAAIHGAAPVEQLWQISRLDENWQEEQWGSDDEAAEVAERKRRAFLDAHAFYQMVQAKA